MIGPGLIVENLNAWYGDSHILQGVSLAIPQGAAAAILGRNGAGKTTTLKSIMGLTPRRSGSVRLGALKLDGLPAYRVARAGVAYVPEVRGVFSSLSVEENLTVSARATQGGWTLEQIFDRFPRLANRRNHGGNMLSGGEQQRVAVGRALINSPAIILADEPSGNLDSKNAKDLHQLLLKLNQETGQTIVIVTHNTELANMANRKLEMVDGKLIS